MALVNPNIALSVKPLELQPRNALAETAQVMNLQQAQMQMDKLRRTDEAIERIRQVAVKNGGPGDIMEIAQAYMASPDAGHQELGFKIFQQQRDKADFERVAGNLYPDLFPARAAAAPAAAAPAAAPVNALAAAAPAAAATAPAAAPVNALTAPAAAVGKTPDQLRREIMLFSQSTDPRAKSMVDVLKGQLQELTKTHTVGGRIVSGAGNVLYMAPTEMGALEQEIETLRASGAPANDPRIVARQNKIRKLSTHAPAPTMINVQEKAEAGAYGKMLVDQYQDISKAAGLAIKTLPAIEANLGALNKGLDTGFGTDAKKAGARILGALGVQDAEKFAANAEMFQSNAINAVLQKQLEQKGPQTESDARRIEQVGAELGKTKAANEFILSMAKEQLRRDVEQRNFYDKWKKQTGSFEGAEDAWFSGEGGKSLFDRPALKKYAPGVAAGGAAVQQIPGQRPAPAPAAAAIPQAAIDALKAGRGTDAQFDAIFGPGAAKRVRGQ